MRLFKRLVLCMGFSPVLAPELPANGCLVVARRLAGPSGCMIVMRFSFGVLPVGVSPADGLLFPG